MSHFPPSFFAWGDGNIHGDNNQVHINYTIKDELGGVLRYVKRLEYKVDHLSFEVMAIQKKIWKKKTEKMKKDAENKKLF